MNSKQTKRDLYQPRRPDGVGQRRGLFILAGLVIGLVIGLVLHQRGALRTRTIAHLNMADKEEVIVLIGAAYAVDGDLAKAQARLAQLEAPNIHLWVNSLIERAFAQEWPDADRRHLVALAQGVGLQSPRVVAYLMTLTPQATPLPTATFTRQPSPTPTLTLAPTMPTQMPTELPATDTPMPLPTNSPVPASETPSVALPTVKPTDTPRPAPTEPPVSTPTHEPATRWTWAARLVGPGQENQTCSDGLKLVRVTVVDAAGNQIPGVWLYEQYTGQYRVTGHKGDDPFWGPGEAEFSNMDGARVCIATGEGGSCESDLTRDLLCHDPPPFEDMWAAGYCECCRPGISQDDCRALYDVGECLFIAHYAWRVEFRRSN